MITESKVGEKAEEQLLRLIAEGDIRAIKLYYDLTEQETKRRTAEKQTLPDLEEMAAIRRAVFGDEILREAVLAAGEEKPIFDGCIPIGGEEQDEQEGGGAQ